MKSKEKKSGGSKAVSIIMGILCIIFIPIILINLTLIVKTYTTPDHIPSIFGIKPVIVLSGSMEPTIKTGDLIFTKEVDTANLKENDVITYLSGESAITHRIVGTEQGADGQTAYLTKGDYNNANDDTAVTAANVEGIYIGRIAGLGNFAMFLQSTTGMIVFLVCPILLFVIWDVLKRRKNSKTEKEKAEALEAEILALKREKAKKPVDS